YPLPYGMSVAVAAEQPNVDFSGPFGQFGTDTNQIPTSASCAALTQTALNTVGPPAVNAATNITNACLGNPAFFNAAQNIAPDFVARWRIEQPWGHLQAGAVVRDLALNDGEYVNKSWIGYGGSLSGNFFTWGKDNLTWGVAGGDGIGDGIGNNVGVATNFGGALTGQAVNATDSRSNFSLNRPLYDAAVLATTIVSWSGRIGYQHWWTPELRSTVDFSVKHNDIPALVQATGRAANNKELALAPGTL